MKKYFTFELIERKKQGFNKPDRLYLLHPEEIQENKESEE